MMDRKKPADLDRLLRDVGNHAYYLANDIRRSRGRTVPVLRGYLERVVRNLQKFAAFSPSHDWQPMETAPKDGSTIIAWDGIEHLLMFWHQGAWRERDLDENVIQPTQWLPLPRFCGGAPDAKRTTPAASHHPNIGRLEPDR